MVAIRVEGLKETLDSLNAKAASIKSNVDVAIQESAILVKEEVQASIKGERGEPRSVKTGAFLNSIANEKTGEMEAEVSTDLPYPVYLEYGTSKIEERRHFRNSLDRTTPIILEKVEQSVKEIIE
jgi:hypothetical protein